ncbi:hypothetical protein EG351_03265 [Chryseobacterium bernardetii]|nr:hypothetical protein EG351_03265 [Chryseobacterium bernardetii]
MIVNYIFLIIYLKIEINARFARSFDSVTKMSAKAFHSAIDYFAERSAAANEKFKAYYIIFLANLALKINLKVNT